MISTFLKTASALALTFAAAAASAEETAAFDFAANRMFVFGDSLSDTGNTGANPAVYFNGRFSNGIVWHEHLKSGLAIDPFLTGVVGSNASGINFAHGGARTAGFPVAPGVILPGTLEQTSAYAALVATNKVSAPTANDVFAIWIGGNNFLSALGAGGLPNIAQAVADVKTATTTLANAGARRFILMSLPPLGSAVQ